MSIWLVVVLVILVVALLAVLANFGPKPLDMLGLNPEDSAQARVSAEAEDMRQLLELTNRQRRLDGKPEVTEDDLRYGPHR